MTWKETKVGSDLFFFKCGAIWGMRYFENKEPVPLLLKCFAALSLGSSNGAFSIFQ